MSLVKFMVVVVLCPIVVDLIKSVNAIDMITWAKNHDVGTSVCSDAIPRSNPFSVKSADALINAFKEQENTNKAVKHGRYNVHTTLAQNERKKLKALGIDGKLSFGWGPISGDAKIQFAMNNIKGSLDLTTVIHATQKDKLIKVPQAWLNKLELDEIVEQQIDNDKLDWNQFIQKYGEYLIIGKEYGGEIILTSTYSTKSSGDKTAVAGALSVRYEKLGFHIGGAAKGKYNDQDIAKAIDIETEYKLFPNFADPNIQKLIGLFQNVSNPNLNDLKFDENESGYGNIKSELDKTMQILLGGDRLDVINAILFPMNAISCITKRFSMHELKKRHLKPFYKFANPLFVTMNAILLSLQTVDKNWNEIDENKPQKYIIKWKRKLKKCIVKMEIIHGDALYQYAEKYYNYIAAQDKYDDTFQIDKPFYEMDADFLEDQFKEQILKPYDDMISNQCTEEQSKDERIEILQRQTARIMSLETEIDGIKDVIVTLSVKGIIVAWTGNEAPYGWYLCDGQNGTPDLRGRFIYGYGGGYQLHAKGGEQMHTLSTEEMPQHLHYLSSIIYKWDRSFKGTDGVEKTLISDPGTSGRSSSWISHTDYRGAGRPHNNMPPYYVLAYIMKS